MFTGENFRRIYDKENRKGVNIAGRFFPSLNQITNDIRTAVGDIRALRKNKAQYQTHSFNAEMAKRKNDLRSLRDVKNRLLNTELETVSSRVRQSSFKLTLDRKDGPNKKPLYCIAKNPEAFFVSKQLQQNIRKIYGVKQASRHELAKRVRDTVESKFPFEIVRTDVADFYETLDRAKLLTQLERDQLLSTSSKKYIRQMFDSYANLSGVATGIPRGAGVSAYLAELYMRDIDCDIQKLPGLILYCRFVDDIVAVFARPREGKPIGSYCLALTSMLEKHGLKHNPLKTSEISLANKLKQEFEYLGYRFILEKGQCRIRPSDSKISKYLARVNASFDDFHAKSSLNSRTAYRELVGRIRFLTGNTRLLNSKSRAMTGVYFNNALVNDPESFKQLDRELKTRLSSVKRKKLRSCLKSYTFTQGFQERRFHNFSAVELGRITRLWKHG